MKRGVRYRVVIEIPNSIQIVKTLKNFINEPNFKVRFISNQPQAELTVIDEKETTVSLVRNAMIREKNLKTNNSACVEMFKSHFEKVWDQAGEYELNKIEQKLLNM